MKRSILAGLFAATMITSAAATDFPNGMSQAARDAVTSNADIAFVSECIASFSIVALRTQNSIERRQMETYAATMLQTLPEVAVLSGVRPIDGAAVFGLAMMPTAGVHNDMARRQLADALIGPRSVSDECIEAASDVNAFMVDMRERLQ